MYVLRAMKKGAVKKDAMEINYSEILKNFMDGEGRITIFPSKRKMKSYVLFYLAEKFEADTQYTEKEINELLKQWHTFSDPATLRRELYMYHFLDRSDDGKTYCLRKEQPTPEALGL